jgi:hypothetical protein
MQKIHLIITDNGDGSNSLLAIKTKEALAKAQAEADAGNPTYASEDGLQVRELEFPDEFAVNAWVALNFYGYSDEDVLTNFEN